MKLFRLSILLLFTLLLFLKVDNLNAQNYGYNKTIENEIQKFYSQLFKIYESDTIGTPNYIKSRNKRLELLFFEYCDSKLRKKAVALINNGYGNDLFTKDYIGDSNFNIKTTMLNRNSNSYKVSFDVIYFDAPVNSQRKHINVEIIAVMVNNKLKIKDVK
jgi:hypothetical protein